MIINGEILGYCQKLACTPFVARLEDASFQKLGKIFLIKYFSNESYPNYVEHTKMVPVVRGLS